MSTYGWILLLGVLVPFMFSFHPRIAFYRKWIWFFPASLLTAFFFIPWDIWFTGLQVWGFNPEHVMRFRFFNLPGEEVLFFLVIPYCSVFTYEVFRLLFRTQFSVSFSQIIALILLLILIPVGIVHFHQLYTFSNFILASVLLILIVLPGRNSWTGHFFFSYFFLLIPFFIINGLLTGSMLDSPVVWYHPSHNLGIRVLTIPVEDFVYGMNLLLMNVFFYEWFKEKGWFLGNKSGDKRSFGTIGKG